MAVTKLYYSPGSCSIAAHFLLIEIKVPSEVVRTPAKGGIDASFRSINPKMRVPTLSVENEIITETTAVLTAIAQQDPSRCLLGANLLETVRVYEWMNYLSGTLHSIGWRALLRPDTFSDDVSAFEGIKAKAEGTIQQCYQHVENMLDPQIHKRCSPNIPWAVGGQMTIVDFALYAYWRWGASRSMLSSETHPRYTAIIRELGKLDSMKRVLKVEGVEGYLPE